MNYKELLGTQAYWTINKKIANEWGIYPTLLLQHLIDLDEGFFKGMESGFYQQQKRMVKDLPMSITQLRNATAFLVDKGILNAKREGVPPKYHYSINYETLDTLMFKGQLSKRLETSQERLIIKDNNNTNNQDTKLDDVYGKIFFKIVELYPKNRVGNRQHGLKKFKALDIDQAKLALKNLDRYLNLAGEYVKSLQNYISEECFSNEWLEAQQETKRKVKSKTDINHNFSGNYNIIK